MYATTFDGRMLHASFSTLNQQVISRETLVVLGTYMQQENSLQRYLSTQHS